MDGIITDLSPQPPKGIIYGPPGVGKSTFAAAAPGGLILDCENGLGRLRCPRTPYLGDWAAISHWLGRLENEDHAYQTIAVDTLDWLCRRAEEFVSGEGKPGRVLGTLNRSHGGYGNGLQVLRNVMYQLVLPVFDRLVQRGVGVVLLAHAVRTKLTDAEGVTVEKLAPDLSDDLLPIFLEWSDFCFCLSKNPDGTRVLQTEETSRLVAKNRYGMSGVIEANWDHLIHYVTQPHPQTGDQQ